MANTALLLANDVFNERGIQVNPYRVYDTQEELYRRGLAKRAEVLGDSAGQDFNKDEAIRTHIGAALRLGLTQDQIREICFQQTFYIGTQNARRAKMLAEEVFLAN